MAQIIVRNLDDAVVERLKARARDNDRSLEAEVRHILEQSAKGGHDPGSPNCNGEARETCREGKFADVVRADPRG